MARRRKRHLLDGFLRALLEMIECLLGDEDRPRIVGFTIRAGKIQTQGGGVNMSVSIATNQSVVLTGSAVMSDGTVEDLSVADAGATIAWTEDSAAAIAALSAAAGGSVTDAAVAPGTQTVSATATLSDGRTFPATVQVIVTAVAVTIVGFQITPGTPQLK